MHNEWQQFMEEVNKSANCDKIELSRTESRLFDLNYFGIIKISGVDSEKFLQGQLTCDVRLTHHTAALGAHCTPQGRIISLFRIIKINQDYFLILPRNMTAIAIAALKKYSPFYKSDIADVSDEMILIGYQGELPTHLNALTVFPATPDLSRHFILGTQAEIKDAWVKLSTQAAIAESALWKNADICTNIPSIYPETSGKFLPHELNLPELGAVNFDKGCYTGQEIIARMHYRGKLKSHLYQTTITSDVPPQLGRDLTVNNHATVVDFCQQGYNSYIVLIVATEEL